VWDTYPPTTALLVNVELVTATVLTDLIYTAPPCPWKLATLLLRNTHCVITSEVDDVAAMAAPLAHTATLCEYAAALCTKVHCRNVALVTDTTATAPPLT
jgi:hypothetical protein